MELMKVGGRATIRLCGGDELSAVAYACAAVQNARKDNVDQTVKRTAHRIGILAGKAEGSRNSSWPTLEVRLTDFAAIQIASGYYLSNPRALKFETQPSDALLASVREIVNFEVAPTG